MRFSQHVGLQRQVLRRLVLLLTLVLVCVSCANASSSSVEPIRAPVPSNGGLAGWGPASNSALVDEAAIAYVWNTGQGPDLEFVAPDPTVGKGVQPRLTPVTREAALVALAELYQEIPNVTVGPQSIARTRLPKGVNEFVDELWQGIVAPRSAASEVFVVLFLLLLVPQGVFTMLWMLYAWNDPHRKDQGGSPREYSEPHYTFTALVPARHEEMVIKDTIYAVNAIDYPSHMKEILVIIRDEDDDETIAKVKEAIAELGNEQIRLITFNGGPKNKPNGLNRGLRVAKNQVVCIFDAEDEPHPEIYDVVNTVMLRDSADVVQSGVQLMNIGSTWFSALNCLEYFFWFRSGLRFFNNVLHMTPLGGNTVFFKRTWLDRIGGWDEQLLTEDADIGIRMTLQGARFQIVYEPEHVTQEETPANVDQFIKQRTRWSQGFYEIFFKLDWWKLPQLRQKLGAMYILMNPLFQASMIVYLPLGIFIALTQHISVSLALLSYIPLAIFAVQLLVTIAGIREFAEAYGKRMPRFFVLKMSLVYYPFQIMLALASCRAIFRFLTKVRAWEKTAHSNMHRGTITDATRLESIDA